MHLRVCSTCVKNRPRCSVCQIPMEAQTANGLCTTCSASLAFCLTCSRPILGAYLEFDGVGPYCQKCAAERPPCDVCSAPLTDERWKLSDGRILCTYCNETAVLTKEQANTLYQQMKMMVERLYGLSLNVPTGLALVDRNQLARVIQRQEEAKLPQGEARPELDPSRTLGLYVRNGMRRGIYIQAGLPRLLFLQVAAHEFAHAWQGENCPLLRNPVYHEGFAEWVAYQVIGEYGYIRGQKRMLKRDDVYGKGLNLFIGIFASQGFVGVIDACQKVD